MKYYLKPVRMAIIKKSTNSRCWRGCGEKENLPTLFVGMSTCAAALEKSMEILLKTKDRTAIWSSNPTNGCILGKDKNSILKGYMHPMFTAALFTVAETWKQPKRTSAAGWIKQTWRTDTGNICYPCSVALPCLALHNPMDCNTPGSSVLHWATKKNETVPSAATWIDIEIIIVSEANQIKTNTIRYHLNVESKK